MLATILSITLSGAGPAAAGPGADAAPVAVKAEPNPLKALDAWLKLYRKGKIDYRSPAPLGKKSIALKYKVRKPNDLGNPTWSGDLELILKMLAGQNDAAAARAIAEVASVGLNPRGKYSYAMAPYSVRSAALDALEKLSSKDAKDTLAAGARGEWKVRKDAAELRAAALLGLGRVGDPAYAGVIKNALQTDDVVTRLHAVMALAHIGDTDSQRALIGVLEAESDDAVLVTAAKSLRSIYAEHVKKEEDKRDRAKSRGDAPVDGAEKPLPPPPTARLAVRAAVAALGRTTWRADMVLVRLLDDFRSVEAIPALVSVLERFRDHPEEVASGKLSGLLQFRAHELLVSMTGAVFSADDPDSWRKLWDKEQDQLAAIAAKPSPTESKKPGSGTSAQGFVGIPVEGTRVVFILDLSGSMEWPMAVGGEELRRLDYAKRELLKAVDGLSPNSMFNLVTFNGDDEAEAWKKELVTADKRNKARFEKFVEKLRPLGGTNLWSGMEKALGIKTLVYGNHYETTVDEIFLLSDGAPSVGDVIDPVEILRLTNEVNRFKEVRINTVFISSRTPPEVTAAQANMSLSPKELMRRMARENGGKFRDV
ncbi:MAG: HEAT repeat domain-containing protein [Planctomycetota bacterium]|nr:HEAT repeat domain-containing protein [Planctomycetota bacterium]